MSAGAITRIGGILVVLAWACLAPSGAVAVTQFGATFTVQTTEAPEGNYEFVNKPYVFTQAGGHPYGLTTTIDFNTETLPGGQVVPVQDPRDIAVELPPGMVGDPLATSRCTLVVFASGSCPGSTQVGWVKLHFKGGNMYEDGVYNLMPPEGVPAELGIKTVAGVNFLLSAGVDNAREYRLRTFEEGVPMSEVVSVEFTIWGVPAEASHDPQRGRDCALGCLSGGEPDTEPPVPFLSMPTDCVPPNAQATDALLETDSWENPGVFVTPEGGPATLPAVTGCDKLVFQPRVQVEPETQQADAPDGLHVNLTLPQTNTPERLATPALKDAVVTLPPGMSLSPGAGDGLQACSDAQFDVESSTAAGCPEQSQVGTVEVESPLLSHPLKGDLFVAEPLCGNAAHANACTPGDAAGGNLFRMFLQVRGEGVTVKLPGTVSVDQETGQLTTTFAEDPQLPFEHLRLHIEGGPRAVLANPQSCAGMPTGPGGLPLALTTSDLTPWSAPETPDATPVSSFEVTGCAASMGFAPAFTAGTVTPMAGAFTPFTLTFSRHDGEQDLAGVSLTMPPGVTARLAGVPLCEEPQAAQGTCPDASRIGTVHVAAGAGSQPLWVEGPVYLTGPYKGAPLGLSVSVPAKAGPFNLGDVIVRSAVSVDPQTAQVTVRSDPFPQSRDGVPFRLKTVNVTIDRPDFILNPTDCSQLQISGAVSAEMPDGSPGAIAPVSTPFAVAGCKNLPFKPHLKLQLKGATKRSGHPALRAVLRMPGGNANIARAAVTLPHSEFLDNAHIGTVCTRVQFAEGQVPGEKCPAGSIYGRARAFTPLLDQPLEGPVYLRSSNHKLPDLVAALNGQIQIALDGRIDSVRGGIRTSFEAVPDAPVSKFVLEMQGGNKGLLVNSTSTCAKTNRATARFDAQSGKLHDLNPVVKADCGASGKKQSG